MSSCNEWKFYHSKFNIEKVIVTVNKFDRANKYYYEKNILSEHVYLDEVICAKCYKLFPCTNNFIIFIIFNCLRTKIVFFFSFFLLLDISKIYTHNFQFSNNRACNVNYVFLFHYLMIMRMYIVYFVMYL